MCVGGVPCTYACTCTDMHAHTHTLTYSKIQNRLRICTLVYIFLVFFHNYRKLGDLAFLYCFLVKCEKNSAKMFTSLILLVRLRLLFY